MKPSDLDLLFSLSRPTVRPDGGSVVVAVSRPDLASDSYVGQLWSVELPDGTARRITRGRRDSAPQFSPDGSMLAFLRQVDTGPAQLVVMAASGAEPMRVTDRTLGVNHFVWAPDSASIAFVSREPEHGRYGTVEKLEANAEPPRHITSQRYLSNGVGYITDRRAHVFQVRIADVTAEPDYPSAPSLDSAGPSSALTIPAAQLTFGDVDHGAIAFSPDARQLAVVSARHDSRDSDLRSDIHLVTVDNPGEVTTLTGAGPALSIGAVLWDESGALYFLADELGETARDFIGRAASLYVVDAGAASARRLTGASFDLGEVSSDITIAGDAVLVQCRERGRNRTMRVTPAGEITWLGSPEVVVTGQDAAAGRIVVSFAGPTTSGDLALVDGDTFRPITDFSQALRARGIREATEFAVTGRAGYLVHGWAMTPEGEGPHPTLVNIHGGPFTQYSVALMDEFQVYVDAGYAVLFCNPRGAAGYGEEHGRSIRQAMGTVDADDVIDFVEGALQRDAQLDGSRLGIMGGSYGGYLTAWITAHDHRFTAAIVERGFLDPFSFAGTSDIGFFFGDEYVGTDAAALVAQSPLAHVHQVTTPTFIIHSENDLRCPLEQGQRYYAALTRQGVHTEMLIFPGENHELSRAGRPRHRQQRFEHILAWWAKYLPSAQNRPAGEAS